MNDRGSIQPTPPPLSTAQYLRSRKYQRVLIKGQDRSRWTDFYHAILTAPWWLFFAGLAVFFALTNVAFALVYLTDPAGIEHARPGSFWDRFLFSVQTIGSINYSVMVPRSTFVMVVAAGNPISSRNDQPIRWKSEIRTTSRRGRFEPARICDASLSAGA